MEFLSKLFYADCQDITSAGCINTAYGTFSAFNIMFEGSFKNFLYMSAQKWK